MNPRVYFALCFYFSGWLTVGIIQEFVKLWRRESTWNKTRDAIINVTMRRFCFNHFCCGKAINITYSECLSVDSVIQHLQHLHRIGLWSVACLVVPHISTISNKCHDIWKKIIDHKICILVALNIFFLIYHLRIIHQGVIINVCKVPFRFNET